jgi:hypothetical protein
MRGSEIHKEAWRYGLLGFVLFLLFLHSLVSIR